MKRTRLSAEQIVTKLREADAMLAAGQGITQVVQALGVSEQTFHRWRSQYGGMKADEATDGSRNSMSRTRGSRSWWPIRHSTWRSWKEANSYLGDHQRGGRWEGGCVVTQAQNRLDLPECRICRVLD